MVWSLIWTDYIVSGLCNFQFIKINMMKYFVSTILDQFSVWDIQKANQNTAVQFKMYGLMILYTIEI